MPPVYRDLKSFQQAMRNKQQVSIEQKWVLGVQIRDAQGTEWPNHARFEGGVYIVAVTPGTPAHKAGLLPGDIIFHVDNTPVRNMLEFLFLLNASDGKVVLSIKRSPDIYKSITKSIRLKKFEASPFVGGAPKLLDQTFPGK
jgi:C-terminal processing protease CtpA/Prc